MKVISARFYNLHQSWIYERIIKVDDHKLRVVIRRNAYDDQSYVRGYALDPVKLDWNCLVDKPIAGASCYSISYVLPVERANRLLFEKDADAVIEELKSIVF